MAPKAAAKMENIPAIKLGVVGVSRDCFPASITRDRLAVLGPELAEAGVDAHVCRTLVESESDVSAALKELAAVGANALFVYLGNFGPETPTTMLMQRFPGPVMVAGAAEEDSAVLVDRRGDALCGLLSNSFNLHMRGVRAYIPANPIGLPRELALAASDFAAIARVVVGVRSLKLFVFGPRPNDFITCHAPLQPLYDLGVEVMEESELDLLREFRAAADAGDELAAIAADMAQDFPAGKYYADLLPRLAQYELALLRFRARNLGLAVHAAFAVKCWPAFGPEFGFEPCYVHSHMAQKGFPVACEVDVYGALSEFMSMCASLGPATILDVNNSVPSDMAPRGRPAGDLFMGFHCGNTCAACLKPDTARMKYNFMMQRGIGADKEPDIARGTIEGQIRPGENTWFRLQGTPRAGVMAYVAEGVALDIDPRTFGGTGVFAIPGFRRFYRHALVGRGFPHHAALTYGRVGEILYEALRLLGIDDIGVPLPDEAPYAGENLFAWARDRRLRATAR